MSPYALSVFLALSTLLATPVAKAATNTDSGPLPLESYSFTWPNIPYQVNPYPVLRGPQVGYNICNSTTAGPTSMCQTSFLNNIADWCLWAPSTPNTLISDSEAAEVAWCTTPDHGTRVIPAGAIQGVQYTKTEAYVQVVGFIDQTQIDMTVDDGGGELDPAGADGLGNPIGSLVFSNSLPSSTGNNSFIQAKYWHNFMGSGMFCFKACDAFHPNAADYCQHIYDRIGCEYNAPASYSTINGTFTSCQGELQDYPGVYEDNGATVTYQQPPESEGPILNIPYTARVPASSNCVTFSSAALFTAAATPTQSQTLSASNRLAATAKPTGTQSSATATSTKSSGVASRGRVGMGMIGVVVGGVVVVAVHL